MKAGEERTVQGASGRRKIADDGRMLVDMKGGGRGKKKEKRSLSRLWHASAILQVINQKGKRERESSTGKGYLCLEPRGRRKRGKGRAPVEYLIYLLIRCKERRKKGKKGRERSNEFVPVASPSIPRRGKEKKKPKARARGNEKK